MKMDKKTTTILVIGAILLIIFMQPDSVKKEALGEAVQVSNPPQDFTNRVNVHPGSRIQQTFVAPINFTISGIDLWFRKEGTPGWVWLVIQDTSIGEDLVEGGANINSYPDLTVTQLEFPMTVPSTPVTLIEGNEYVLMVFSDGASATLSVNKTEFYYARTDVYPGGVMSLNWNPDPTWDLYFDIRGTPVSGGGACTPTCNYPDTCSESVADGCGGTCTRTTEGNACGASGTCTGGVCQGSTFVPYTSVELEQKFDQVDLAWNGGTGASSSNSVSFWTWDNTPLVEGYLNMYMATGQTKYLDSFVANTDTLIGKASDSDSDGLLDWGALQSGIDPVLDYSRITFPFVKFAYIVKKDNLAAYMNKADQYQSFVETNIIPLYDAIYATCSNMGFWKEGVQSAPNNRAAFIGRTHLYLYLISGNSVYETKSIEYANKIKSTLLERTDGPTGSPYYFWNYNNKAGCQTIGNTWSCSVSCAADQDDICDTNPSAWSCSGPLELGYGNYDIMTILDYYEAGIVFASSDLQKLINTVKEGLLVETAIVGGIDTPVMTANADPNNIPITWGNGPYSQTAQSAHWGRLGHYDTTIKTAFDKIVRFTIEHNEASGNNYYSSPYECVIDTRNGVEMCGDDLTGAHRSTPAFSTSMIAHQRLGSETLTLIGSGGGAPVCSLSFNNYISYANSWVECNSPTCS
jgi:hypothetical protein